MRYREVHELGQLLGCLELANIRGVGDYSGVWMANSSRVLLLNLFFLSIIARFKSSWLFLGLNSGLPLVDRFGKVGHL